jgi:nicotinamidase-related amidase
MAKRIVPTDCWGAIIDVQEFFISQAGRNLAPRIKANTRNFARLLGYFRIPMVVTLERPLEYKGLVPKEIERQTKGRAAVFEKDFFDLTKERKITAHIKRLKRKQAIIAGCETDVCVLQSCLGLIDLGYQVYVIEDLLFSSARNVDAAVARMRAEGAVFLTYKTLYYELIESVEGNPHSAKMLKTFGPFPDDLPDAAV